MQEETDGEGSATGDIAALIEAVEAPRGLWLMGFGGWVGWLILVISVEFSHVKVMLRRKQAKIENAGF